MTRSLFEQRLLARVARAHVQISAAQVEQLHAYYELLRKWNRRVNLTSLVLDDYPDQSLDRLLVEPLVAARLVSCARTHIDLGSGGGSPGIPIKIALPETQVFLIESRERKSAFLRGALRELALAGAEVLTVRAECVPSVYARSADAVSVRALLWNEELINSVRRVLKPSGTLLTFGAQSELAEFRIVDQTSVEPDILVQAWRLKEA